jgi:arylsulfatase A-like enzyme
MSRPNVLFIMTDQHNARCFGYRGHPDVKTPNINRLADEGVRFDEAFVQNGVCVPSRVSYLTGLYPHNHGVFGNDLDPISDDLRSLPSHLQLFGYDTALIGKKHLPGWHTHGFQYEKLCYHADAPLRQMDYYNYLKQHGLHAYYDDLGDVEKFCMKDDTLPVEHSLEKWTADETIEYLNNRDEGDPFFLMTSFERPHPPLTFPEGCPFEYDPGELTLPDNTEEVESAFFFNRNVELKWCSSHHGESTLRRALANYYSLISLVDYNIGRIIDCLEENGLRENTIIVCLLVLNWPQAGFG